MSSASTPRRIIQSVLYKCTLLKIRAYKAFDFRQRKDNQRVKKGYVDTANTLDSFQRNKSAYSAVVAHLYYIESWPLLKSALARLEDIKFDLFISLPSSNEAFINEIYKTYPEACVVIVPNRGRDVLPFMQILSAVIDKGYEHVLKVHSKKSTHRKDGGDWFESIINNLVPDDSDIQSELVHTLEQRNTGIIGPKDEYVSLEVNFPANGAHMTRILERIYTKKIARNVLQENRQSYGFFAGTMFWARTDALKPIANAHFSVKNFELEKGQIDGTFAHALERVFCLASEIDKKNLYTVGNEGVKLISYDSGTIPDWSEVYIGPNSGS